MKELISFTLRRRFINGSNLIFNVLIFMIAGCILFSDILINWINPSALNHQKIYLNTQDELSLSLQTMDIEGIEFIYRDEETEKLLEADPKSYVLTFEEGYKLVSSYALNNTTVTMIESLLTTLHQTLLLQENLTEEQFIQANHMIDVENKIINQHVQLDENKQNLLFMVITSIYFTMLSCSTSVANEIIYEKSTRQLELILTSISARKHFASKILVGWLAILMQGGMLFMIFLFWILIRHLFDGGEGLISLINQLNLYKIHQTTFIDVILSIDIQLDFIIKVFFIFIFLMIGILLTQIILSIFSSFISSIENASAIQSPFYIILMIVYYFTLSVNTPYQMSEGIGYICSFIPFLSMLFMPCRLMIQNVSIYELILSLLISMIFMLLVTKNGMDMYERGVLDHSQFKNIWQILKKNQALGKEKYHESEKIKEYS